MGFLDKLLGRSKQAVDTAEDKLGMHHDHDHGDAEAPTAEAPAPVTDSAPAADPTTPAS
jgi:hypothetical protein